MLQHLVFTLSCLLVFGLPGFGQDPSLSNFRKKKFNVTSSSFILDTLSIIPGTLRVLDSSNALLDPASFHVDFIHAEIFLDSSALTGTTDTLTVEYRVFPYMLAKEFFHKDGSWILQEDKTVLNPFIYSTGSDKPGDFFSSPGLTKSGSISRGISFGNNQDVVVNSNMDIGLSGKISENIEILAAITDNNIPFQPEGNTQQIQEFDKVFIQLSDGKTKLLAGDFELKRPQSYFMNFYKKAQGASFSTPFNKFHGVTNGSIAISKGKYSKNITVNGSFNNIMQEGNQGPYKLRGAENETFIIVLSGTERVYIDGMLLARGQDNDYVIDYNTAEITFTPRYLITKDKRIVVEFEYSERNYMRTMFFTGTGIRLNRTDVRVNIYSEQDNRNQPVMQDLDDDRKIILRDVGDDLDAALAPGVTTDTSGSLTNRVLYRKTDSLVNYSAQNKSFVFKDVYVYGAGSDAAVYLLSFSLVGEGNGSYRQASSTVNGKVFEWVAPLLNPDGTFVLQGSYEPVVKLVTPKKKQMAVVAADHHITENLLLSYEGAISNNDLNTFSPLDSDDDVGYAHRILLKNVNRLDPKNRVETAFSYENKGKTFSAIDRYRPVEFDRDWNIPSGTQSLDEHLLGGELSLLGGKSTRLKYSLHSFYRGSEYRALRNSLSGALNIRTFFMEANGSFLNSTGLTSGTQFIRHKAAIGKKIRGVSIGVREETEENYFRDMAADTLLPGAFAYYIWEAFASTPDTATATFNLSYKERTDRLPLNNRLKPVTRADDISFASMFLKNPKNQFKTTITWRQLKALDTVLTAVRSDNTVLGRVEHHLRMAKGAVALGTFYEIGTGQEYKKEFYYIKVPAGEGLWMWNDYNENGIEDLNEFELSTFKDKAEYLRIYTPTNQLQRTRINLFNQTVELRPASLWSGKQGIKKFLCRFTDQAAYRIDKKTMLENLYSAYNPYLINIDDTALITINYSFRNTFYYNRTSPLFGLDINYQANRGKSLLTNGFDSRSNEYGGGKMRMGAGRIITLFFEYTRGLKTSFSEYFASRNFRISYSSTEPQAVFQQGTKTRLKLSWKYTEKRNAAYSDGTGGEKGFLNNIGLEVKRSAAGKGYWEAKANFIDINYKSPENTPVAYEILEGLNTGRNITWNLSYQQNLSDHMQMSLSYDGRKSEKAPAVHTGSVQLRAFF